MQYELKDIGEQLRRFDIEGLIAAGAPSDEYKNEAEIITDTFNRLHSSEQTYDNLLSIISATWLEMFNLDEKELTIRMSDIEALTVSIIKGQPSV